MAGPCVTDGFDDNVIDAAFFDEDWSAFIRHLSHRAFSGGVVNSSVTVPDLAPAHNCNHVSRNQPMWPAISRFFVTLHFRANKDYLG